MKKSLITLVAALVFGLSLFAGTNMIVKLNNGENVKFNVENVKEVVFEETQEADTTFKFTILSDSTVSVRCGVSPENLKGDVVIPSTVKIDGKVYTVTEIEERAFESCDNMKNITIPPSVTTIGAAAFKACWHLTDVEIPNGVTRIEDQVFELCLSLTSVKIPNTVTSISEFAFEGCTGLTNLTIPSSVKYIDWEAFKGCENLNVVILNAEEDVTVVSGAFDDCKSVTCKIIDESESPFKFKVLTETTAEVIRKNCVEGSVTIPSKVVIDGKTYRVVSIGNDAFGSCKGLTNITIPSSVVNIGTDAFRNSGLTTIELPSRLTSIGLGLFLGCSDLVSVKIPLTVGSIGESAFVDCTSLTNLELSSSVETIGVMAFYGCKNLDLVIDNSEDNVEVRPQAFQNCKSVTWKK